MTYIYAEATFTVGSSNTQAFKEGSAVGKCLQYQQTLIGQKHSTEQVKSLWSK